MRAGLPIIKIVLTASVLVSLGLSAGMLSGDTAIQKKIHRSGTTALTISNQEMEGIMKIVTSLKQSGILIKETGEKIKNEAKQQKGRFLLMLLGKLAASVCVCVCVCVCGCVCVCVFTSIQCEGFFCLDQLEYHETGQRCHGEDVNFLCQVPSLLL